MATRALLLAMLCALVLSLLFTATVVRAADSDDDEDNIPRGEANPSGEAAGRQHQDASGGDSDEPDTVDEEAPTEEPLEQGGVRGVFARAFFPKNGDLVFPAGEIAPAIIAFENGAENPSFQVVFAAAHLAHVADPNYYIQNFSGVMYNRAVAPTETSTFKYNFKPHEMLDPQVYTLVVRLFFQNDENATFVVTAFNETVTVADALGTDPQTVMTFGVVTGLLGAGAYYVYTRRLRRRGGSKKKEVVEMGTGGGSYDPTYVSKEHLAYEERRKSASPAKRSTSGGSA